MSKRTKKRLLSLIMCLVVVVSLLMTSMPNFTTVADAATGENVTSKLSNVKVSIKNGDTYIINQNTVTGEALVHRSIYYDIDISWELNERVNPDDYFYIDLGKGYFFFNPSAETPLVNGSGVTIGKWKVEGSQSDGFHIKCTFTDNCVDYNTSSGFFQTSGNFVDRFTDTSTFTFGGIEFTVNSGSERQGFTKADKPAFNWARYGVLSKGGYHELNNNLEWYIYGNFDNAEKIYTNLTPTAETIENVVIKDELDEWTDLFAGSINVYVPIYYPKDANTLSDEYACRLNLTNQLTNVNEYNEGGLTFASQAEWETYINEHPLTYGYSKDRKTVLVNLGNLPGSIQIANDAEDFRAKLLAKEPTLTTVELDALVDMYEIDGSFPLYGFLIVIGTPSYYGVDKYEQGSYTNTVSLTHEHMLTPYSVVGSGLIKQAGGGSSTTPSHSATLILKDVDTDAQIKGATFHLEILTDEGWVPLNKPTQITNDNGKVTYTDLAEGTYRFVEDVAASGYDITSIAFPNPTYIGGEFTVTDSDIAGHIVHATNKQFPSVTLTLTDANNSDIKIDDVDFKLQKFEAGTWVDCNDCNNASSKATVDGKVSFEGLLPGTYRVIENVDSVDGYDIDSITYTLAQFTVENSSTPDTEIDATLKKLGTATLVFKDADTSDPIDDSEFKLQVYNGTTWVDVEVTKSTDINGKINYNNLPYGTYRFVEVSINEDYDPSTLEYDYEEFVISETATEFTVNAICGKVVVPSQPETSTTIENSTGETTTTGESSTGETTTTGESSTGETTTTGESSTGETTTTGESSTGETTTPNETTTVDESTTETSSESDPDLDTGDNSNPQAWLIIGLVSTLLLVGAFLSREKETIK